MLAFIVTGKWMEEGRGGNIRENLRGRSVILDNNPHTRVGTNVPDVRLSGERQVASVSHQQRRGIVVNAAADAVEAPKSVTRRVLEQLHAKGVGAGRRRRRHLVHGGRD